MLVKLALRFERSYKSRSWPIIPRPGPRHLDNELFTTGSCGDDQRRLDSKCAKQNDIYVNEVISLKSLDKPTDVNSAPQKPLSLVHPNWTGQDTYSR